MLTNTQHSHIHTHRHIRTPFSQASALPKSQAGSIIACHHYVEMYKNTYKNVAHKHIHTIYIHIYTQAHTHTFFPGICTSKISSWLPSLHVTTMLKCTQIHINIQYIYIYTYTHTIQAHTHTFFPGICTSKISSWLPSSHVTTIASAFAFFLSSCTPNAAPPSGRDTRVLTT